jgi:proline iminopeptidase
VQSIVLVGAPVSLQKTFKNIIEKSKILYQSKNDTMNLKYLGMIEKMDTNSLLYSSYCFGHAMQNGFYSPQNPTEQARAITKSLKSDTLLSKLAAKMTYEAVQGFWKNEHYTTLDLTKQLHHLQNRKILIYGLYGKEDGLYSTQQIEELQNMVGPDNVKYLDNCSHSVFIDQQEQFHQSINQWLK